jgi:hypothetical protein
MPPPQRARARKSWSLDAASITHLRMASERLRPVASSRRRARSASSSSLRSGLPFDWPRPIHDRS